jgi:hypothetical protein
MVVNLICSYNNVIFLLNFICLVFLFVFVLFLFNLINITLFILLIYATLINLLFLVNGILLMSSYNYIYYSLSSHFIINNYDISFICASIINHNFNNIIIHISTIHFYNLCYLSSYSTLLNIGFNRLGHVIFDNSLFCLIWTIFFINLINLNIIFLIWQHLLCIILSSSHYFMFCIFLYWIRQYETYFWYRFNRLFRIIGDNKIVLW